MNNIVKIGIFGAKRAKELLSVIHNIPTCKLTAVCNRAGNALLQFDFAAQRLGRSDIKLVHTFEELLESDVDLIILANYAHQHAPYAIQALRAGKHVLSETMAVATLKEAVELIEAVEETGMEYSMLDHTNFSTTMNYLRTICTAEEIISFESEHAYELYDRWKKLTGGNKALHWRNQMASTTYCTHGLGAILNFMKSHPVSVSATESGMDEDFRLAGKVGACQSTMCLKFDDATTIKHTINFHNTPTRLRITFNHCDGRKWTVDNVNVTELNEDNSVLLYKDDTKRTMYWNGDKDCITLMVDKILGKDQDYSKLHDVYEAVDATLPGILGFKSIMEHGKEIEIPDLRNKSVREQYRNDTFCTFPDVGGDMYVPADIMWNKQ